MNSENVKKIYEAYENVYTRLTKRKWSWKSGQKARARIGFLDFCSQAELDVSDDHFDDQLFIYSEYLNEVAVDWIKWRNASPSNFIGYLVSQERQAIWIARLLFEDCSPTNKSKDSWDF